MRIVAFTVTVGLSVLFIASTSWGRTVRVFAVGNRQAMSDVVTYQDYRDKMFALVDAAYPGRASRVQAGVDDVASHIQPSDPGAPPLVLVNFPEDVGLEAAFVGTRGAGARAAINSTQAYLSLFNTYTPQRLFYLGSLGVTDLFPQIVLALTDTIYRAFYETFRDVAMTYGVYVSATANLPPAVIVTQAEDPTTYNKLIDPDEIGVRNYVYKAVSSVSYNSTFLFQPDGGVFVQLADGTVTSSPVGTGGVIVGSTNKVYLTPIELDLLQLGDAPIDDLDVLDTPVGRIGVVISKDAWMVDLNDRLAARHAHVMVQPEAFSSWGFQTTPWDPDIFKQGGYNNVQKYPNRLYNIAPSMTGNLFEITFDGQTSIIGRGYKGGAGPLDGTNAWIGQNPDTGFLAVAPWIVDDPGISNPSLALADRRSTLVSFGVNLLPSSSVTCPGPLAYGPCRGGYREAVVWQDLEIPDGLDVLTEVDTTPPVPTAFGTSVQVNDEDTASPSSQLFPRLAAAGDSLYAVWQDTRDGKDNIYASMSTDGGATWSADVHVSDNAPGTYFEILPDIAYYRDIRRGVTSVYVVWQRLGPGGNDNDAKVMLARFDENMDKLGSDVRVDDLDGVGKWRPVVEVTGTRGQPVVIWVDERDKGPKNATFEHLRSSRSRGGLDSDGRPRLLFRPSRRVVAKKELLDPHAVALENEWWPAVGANDREVYAAWADFRDYNWDVYFGRSSNGGRKFRRRSLRLDDFPDFERLNSHPSLAVDPSTGRVTVVWADQRERQPDTNIYLVSSTDRGETWTVPQRLDHAEDSFDPDTQVPSNQWEPAIAAKGGRACVAWQDNRLGNNDIFAAASADGQLFDPEVRVDDSGDGPSEQFHPDVAIGSDRCYVIWSDNRSGDFDIRTAARAF